MATAKERLHLSYAEALGEALKAGVAAAKAATPVAMYVATPKNLVGSLLGGDDGGFDTTEPVYYVADGVCGFAWINFKGSAKFHNWLLGKGASLYPATEELGSYREHVGEPRPDTYYGGVTLWVSGFRQSMALKDAFAGGFAKKLSEYGIEGLRVWPMSRMD